MPTYPVSFNLEGRICVVVGGGTIAERKAESLLDFGGCVSVVAPDLTTRLQELSDNGSITHIDDVFDESCLDGAFIAIAATDDRAVNEACSVAARRRGVLVNVVDDPELCTFIVPAVVRRGDLVISVSTSGKCPALARRVKQEIDVAFGSEYGDLVELLNGLRDYVKSRYPTLAQRNEAYVRIMDSEVPQLLIQGKRVEALERARECI